MAVTAANLISGTPQVYIAATGEALPEIDDLDPSTLVISVAGNWTAIGGTIDDHILEYTPTFNPVSVNEHLNPVKYILAGEEGKFMVKFAEYDLTHVDYSMAASTLSTTSAGADQTGQDILKVGSGTAAETAVLVVGTSPEGGSRVLHIPKAIATGGLSIPWSKSDVSQWDVEWTIISDTTLTAGEDMLVVYDITAAATT